MISVAVVARSAVVRAGLESMVRASPALELAAVIGWERLDVGGILAGVWLLEPGNIDADRLPSLARLPAPVVLLLEMLDAGLVTSALRLGIRGILSVDADAEEIEAAVRAVYTGLVVVTPAVSAAMLGDVRPITLVALSEPLSERESEVLALLVEGLSNKLIAYRLEISEHTVKTHVTAILTKLGATSRTEAVAQAIRRGLVML